MITAGIVLRTIMGSFKDKAYVLEAPGLYLIGRTDDCDIQLPAAGSADVSRRHCIVEVLPEGVRVRDLGSMNGTFVNGKKIGQRARPGSPECPNFDSSPAEEIKDGDQIKVGQTVFRVAVFCPDEEQSAELQHAAASEGNA